MKVLSLFSGGGLGDYGLTLAGMEIVGQVEIDEYCQKILNLRWPEVPKWTDIKNVRGKDVLEKCGAVDLIAGGFPCQPFSFAGKRKGEADDRNLWPEMFRIISEIRPTWVLAENVPGVLGFVESVVLPDLEREGYETITLSFPAHALGAPHRRERIWIVGHAIEQRLERHTRNVSARRKSGWKQEEKDGSACAASLCENFTNADKLKNRRLYGGLEKQKSETQPSRFGENMADTSQKLRKWPRIKKSTKSAQSSNGRKNVSDSLHDGSYRTQRNEAESGRDRQDDRLPERNNFWSVEPNVGRVAHGIANRVDRLKLLGNGQVVQVVEWIGKRIMEYENTLINQPPKVTR